MKKIIFIFAVIFTMQSANAWFGDYYGTTTGRGHTLSNYDATLGEIGDWMQLAIPISALIYSTAIGDWEGDWQLAESYGATWATTEILKKTVREERPGEPEDGKGQSFPSGHTSAAFAGAGYWQRRYGWEIGVPMYAAAAFVGYSRVRVKMHNWTDVGVGAALGIGFNYLFTSRYKKDGLKVSVAPTDGGGAYMSFSTKF
ncbi:MAG: phosphatase PAP2 family protein [Rickettsiales bacterium]|jgi:membrane-associated phospholipid phosphatase|nr:phosphatase PAP2 family protein [Rickettsiales bacterium]